MNFDAAKAILAEEALRMGLSEYEIYCMQSSEMSAETLKDEIASFSFGVGGGISFRCIVNGQMGAASTECLEDAEIRALVHRAAEQARYLESEDRAILFAGSEQYASVTAPAAETPDAAALKARALAIQANTYAESASVTDGTQSGVFTNAITVALANSHGLSLSNRVAYGGSYVQAVVQKDGEAQDAFSFTLSSDTDALRELSHQTVEEALSKLGSVEVASGKYDVIFSGKQMRALLSAFASVFSAKQAQLGLSLLRGKEGERMASDAVTLVDDPLYPDCPMQTPFDGEGVATYRKRVIDRGVLQTLLYDLSSADRAGKRSTGNGQRMSYADAVSIRPYSFYLEAGERSEDGLRQVMGDGLYITELKGLHAGCNAATGDFSIESAGRMVRNGVLCESVRSFTVAGNFFELLQQIEALSDTVQFGIPSGFTVYGSPDVLIRQMSIAGK